MPKIQWDNLPREKWAHLRERAKERKISMEDLFELAEWKAQDRDVPDGNWYKDFGTFNFCGTGRPPSADCTEQPLCLQCVEICPIWIESREMPR